MYSIRSRTRTYYAGVTANGNQVLLGWLGDFVGVLLFDKMGILLETREHALSIDRKKGLGPAVEAKARREIRNIMVQLGFRRAPIQVKPFFIENWRVRLKLFPEDLEDFLDHPNDFPEEDIAIFRADVEKWKADGNCVLKWGNEYDLDRDGNTI